MKYGISPYHFAIQIKGSEQRSMITHTERQSDGETLTEEQSTTSGATVPQKTDY